MMHTTRRVGMFSAVALALCGLAEPAHAAILGVSSGITLHATPWSTPPTHTGHAWDEGTNIAFSGPADFWPALATSQTMPSAFPAFAPTQVDSHYLHFNHSSSIAWGVTQTITFSNPIIAVLFTEQNLLTTSASPAGPWATPGLSTSPVPGAPLVNSLGWYNTWGGNEGWVWMNPSQPNVLYMELPVSMTSLPVWSFDSIDIRVLTATPTPGGAALLAFAGLLAQRRRR